MQPVSARVTKQSRIVVVDVQVGCCANVVVKTGHGLWQFCQVELDDYLPVLLPVCVSALSARQPPAPNTLPPPLPAQLLSSAQQWHRVEKSTAVPPGVIRAGHACATTPATLFPAFTTF